MRRRVDLIDQFADLVVAGNDPRTLAERTLDVVIALTNGRCGAVFAVDQERLALVASRGLDQAALDTAGEAWRVDRPSLANGQTFYSPDLNSDARLPKPLGGGPQSAALVPIASEAGCIATLYVDSPEPHFCTGADLERLAKFSRIIEKVVTDAATAAPSQTRAEAWEAYLERTPVEDMQREKLLLLLNRNEWNIARVARLMGVTRRTIYLRLARYDVPRQRVPKTRAARVPA